MTEANDPIVDIITPDAESRIVEGKEIDASTIKRIAAVALTDPDMNTSVGHAFTRRTGIKEILTYLATMDSETELQIEESEVGLYFPDSNSEYAEVTNIKDENSKQRFLRRHADDMAFITNRAKVIIPVDNLRLNVPQWLAGVNQVANSQKSELSDEIETVIGEQGWLVGLAAMASRGMSEDQILNRFSDFQEKYDTQMPKKGWFLSNKRNRLSEYIKYFPKTRGLTLDYETLERIETGMEEIKEYVDRKGLQYDEPADIQEATTIEIKKGNIVLIMPSEHEYLIRSAVRKGINKSGVHKRIGQPTDRFIDRFLTVYSTASEMNYYPQ